MKTEEDDEFDRVKRENAMYEVQRLGQEIEGQPQRTWVGLTDEERDEVWKTHVLPGFHDRQKFYSPTVYAQLIEAKLKEKNT
jgi:hypothetical protein